MYDLYDDLVDAIYSLEDASQKLSALPEEKSVVDELLFELYDKRDKMERAIEIIHNKDVAALTTEYFANL